MVYSIKILCYINTVIPVIVENEGRQCICLAELNVNERYQEKEMSKKTMQTNLPDCMLCSDDRMRTS